MFFKVNQKMAFFGSEIWKPEKPNIGSGWKLGIENTGFKPEIQCIFNVSFNNFSAIADC